MFNKYIDVLSGVFTTILSIIKSEFLINRMGADKFMLMIIVLVIVTLVMLSDSGKMENR